jgi:hypothetical protein
MTIPKLSINPKHRLLKASNLMRQANENREVALFVKAKGKTTYKINPRIQKAMRMNPNIFQLPREYVWNEEGEKLSNYEDFFKRTRGRRTLLDHGECEWEFYPADNDRGGPHIIT